MMQLARDSKTIPGAKVLSLLITLDKNDANKGVADFTMDAYPYSKVDFEYIFSKSKNENLSSYTLDFQLYAQTIERYETKFTDDGAVTEPVYSNRIWLTDVKTEVHEGMKQKTPLNALLIKVLDV